MSDWKTQVPMHCLGCMTARWWCPSCGAPGLTTAPLSRVVRGQLPVDVATKCPVCAATGTVSITKPVSDCPSTAAGPRAAVEGLLQKCLDYAPRDSAEQVTQVDVEVLPQQGSPTQSTEQGSQKFKRFRCGGAAEFDRGTAGELLKKELLADPQPSRRTWVEWGAWFSRFQSIAGCTPASSYLRMTGLPAPRSAPSRPQRFSELAVVLINAELGLPPLGLPGEAELRAQLLPPQGPTGS